MPAYLLVTGFGGGHESLMSEISRTSVNEAWRAFRIFGVGEAYLVMY